MENGAGEAAGLSGEEEDEGVALASFGLAVKVAFLGIAQAPRVLADALPALLCVARRGGADEATTMVHSGLLRVAKTQAQGLKEAVQRLSPGDQEDLRAALKAAMATAQAPPKAQQRGAPRREPRKLDLTGFGAK